MDFLTTNDLIFLTIISIIFISVIVVFANKKIRNHLGDSYKKIDKKLDKIFKHFILDTVIGSGIWFGGNLYIAITSHSIFFIILTVVSLFNFVWNIVEITKKAA